MIYSNPDTLSLIHSAQGDTLSRLWTLEDLVPSVNEVKTLLNWTPLASIEIGVNRERVCFDRGVMSAKSPYFGHFSLPTIAYADQFQRLSKRLLIMTAEETRMFDMIIRWCHTPLDDGSPFFYKHGYLTIDQWCCMWTLADTLQIFKLRELILAAVRLRYEIFSFKKGQLPSHTAIQYLYDARSNYDTYSEALWEEFVMQHYCHPNSPITWNTESLYVKDFVDSVLRWPADSPGLSPESSNDEDENEDNEHEDAFIGYNFDPILETHNTTENARPKEPWYWTEDLQLIYPPDIHGGRKSRTSKYPARIPELESLQEWLQRVTDERQARQDERRSRTSFRLRLPATPF